jgi:site-specific recombinase XerD
MTRAATAPLRDARAAAGPAPTPPTKVAGGAARTMARTVYATHLRTATSKAGDAYSRRTIEGYLEAVDALGDYLTGTGFVGDFPEVDTETLNGFLAAYRATHTQGGTNTKLRRLRPFYAFLEETYGTTSPYRGKVAYYAPSAPPPSALGGDVVGHLLAECRGASFEDVRDAAILRLLATGVRRAELQGLYVEDIDSAGGTITVGAFKDSRRTAPVVRVVDGVEHRLGRVVPLGPEALVALHKWLRVRAAHKLVKDATTGPLWYATRGRGRLTGNGILRMVKRRAQEAGYDPATINAHAFRHTRAHVLLSGGIEEGDVMAVMGWKDRAMLDRYARNLKNERAIDAVRRAGLA